MTARDLISNLRALPLCVELYAGLHGWGEGFVSEGYRCVGYDIVDMCEMIGQPRPEGCELVLRDVRSLHGSEFADANCIVASPPCQAYSYRAMPWKRAKALPPPDNTLFNECFRIQREASEAAGRHIPLIVENVRGAQKWVGRARWHFGSYYLWGDVPALMPMMISQKFNPDGTNHGPGSWFAIADSENRGAKSRGQNWSMFAKTGETSPHFRLAAAGVKQNGSGPEWFDNGIARKGSQTVARSRASALIAKIPFPLASHIARCFKPHEQRQSA